MGFEIITDSASNLTKDLLDRYNIHMLPYHVLIDGEDWLCYDPDRDYDKAGKDFYDKLRNGAAAKTSLVNTAAIEECMRPMLAAGSDVMFVGISSGLSGTVQAARIAADDLSDEFPDRTIRVIDSMGASLGEGLMVIRMAELRDIGASISEAAEYYESNKLKMSHVFTVDDLKFLKRGGRISAAEAIVGSLLAIKPILYATDEGRIASRGKARGTRKALNAVLDIVASEIVDPENQVVGLAHCDAPEAAEYLASAIKDQLHVKDVIVRVYDMCTGAHVGPGTVAVFFMGKGREPETTMQVVRDYVEEGRAILNDRIGTVRESARETAKENGLDTKLEGMLGGVKTVGAGMLDGVKTAGCGMLDGVKTAKEGMIEGMKSAKEGVIEGVRVARKQGAAASPEEHM